MRGEHHAWAAAPCLVKGSSPHARGARVGLALDMGLNGIIPACAESTYGETSVPDDARDHLRMRGEHKPKELRDLWERGSSPHARGARVATYRYCPVNGIIPACAGSTRPPILSTK